MLDSGSVLEGVLGLLLGFGFYVLFWLISPVFYDKAIRRVSWFAPEHDFSLESRRISLSVVIPAFNEEKRLGNMLKAVFEFLIPRESNGFEFEIIVVDDASTDQTIEIAKSFAQKYNTTAKFRVKSIQLRENFGKGGAVCAGVSIAKGEYVLMADADNATKFSDVTKLEQAFEVNKSLVVAIGSRSIKSDRTGIRDFMANSFHTLLVLICPKLAAFKDTQCGFKLFKADAAKKLFKSLHITRWVFDCELLHLCYLWKFQVEEVRVTWREVPGSKLNVAVASIQMLRDLFWMRVSYEVGFWKV